MKTPRLFAAFTILLGFLLACAGLGDLQSKPPPDLTWVGVWEGPGLHLVIHPDGTVEVDRRGGSGSTRMSGPAQRFDTTEISVGIGPISTQLRVDAPPAQADGRWVMTIDNIPMVRTLDVPPPMPGVGDPPPMQTMPGMPPQPNIAPPPAPSTPPGQATPVPPDQRPPF